jgi:hypothetical protein
MRNIFHFILGYLVGDNGQTLVKLHRISINDLAVIFVSNLNRQLPFRDQ